MKSIWAAETLREQLHAELTRRLLSGEIPPGTPLPPKRVLCAEFGVGRNTVAAVIQQLAEERFVHLRSSRPPLAARLRSKRAYRIGLIGPNSMAHRNEFSYERSPWAWLHMRATMAALLEAGHCCVTIARDRIADWEATLDGMITALDVTTCGCAAPQVPYVHLAEHPHDIACNTVRVDRGEAMTQAATWFLAHGIRSFGRIGDLDDGEMTAPFQEHMHPLLHDGGLDAAHEYYEKCPQLYDADGYEAMDRILRRKPLLPLGIFAKGDYLAQGAIRATVEAGLVLKKDVYLVGATGLEESARWNPPISVVTSEFEAVGTALARMMIGCLDSGRPVKPRIIKSRFLIRRT